MKRYVVVYIAIAICLYAAWLQADYLFPYFAEPGNTFRQEYLEGVVLVGFMSSVAWVPLLIASVLGGRIGLSMPYRVLAAVTSGAVALATVAAVIIDVAA